MIEFAVLTALALAVAAYVAIPRRNDDVERDYVDVIALRDQRAQLMHQLRELDEDLASGRLSDDDRTAARRAIGPPLRAVTEALRAHDDGARSREHARGRE